MAGRRDYLASPEDRFWEAAEGRRSQPWVSVSCGRCSAALGRVWPGNSQARGAWPDPEDELDWADMLSCARVQPDSLHVVNTAECEFRLEARCRSCGMRFASRLIRFAGHWKKAWDGGPPSRLQLHPDGTIT
jgi:hypothetical protein